MEAELSELEAALGHAFATPELLVRALTHRSLGQREAVQDRARSRRDEGQHQGRRAAGQ